MSRLASYCFLLAWGLNGDDGISQSKVTAQTLLSRGWFSEFPGSETRAVLTGLQSTPSLHGNASIMITIYHNPRCSKSRECLTLVEDFAARNALQVDVVEYLKSPLAFEQLMTLKEMLGCKAIDMVRSNEEEYAALGLIHVADTELLKAAAAHPKLLQRPIVVFGKYAIIGRPPEAVNDLLNRA